MIVLYGLEEAFLSELLVGFDSLMWMMMVAILSEVFVGVGSFFDEELARSKVFLTVVLAKIETWD